MAHSTHRRSFHTRPTGFVVTHNGERHEYRDDDILGMRIGIASTTDVSAGNAIHQSLDLFLANDKDVPPQWVTVLDGIDVTHRTEHFDALCARFAINLEHRYWSILASGEEVDGGPWTLSLTQLHDRTSGQVVSTQEIARACWRGDDFCIWHEDAQREVDIPIVRFSRNASNTHLLQRLLQRLSPPSVPTEGRVSEVGLGHLIDSFDLQVPMDFKRWLGRGLYALVFLAILEFAIPGALAIGTLALLITSLLLLPKIEGEHEYLECYERGMIWRKTSLHRLLWNNQILAYSVKWPVRSALSTREPCRVMLKLFTADAPPWEITIPVDGMSARMEQIQSLHAHITSFVAKTLQEDFAEKEFVHWTSELAFVPSGLLYVPRHGKRQHVLVRHEITGATLNLESLKLSLNNRLESISLLSSEPNFYPGIRLAQLLGLLKLDDDFPIPSSQTKQYEAGVAPSETIALKTEEQHDSTILRTPFPSAWPIDDYHPMA